MKREDLIKQCRYYHGEDRNPFQSQSSIQDEKLAWFWDMERVYVMHDGIFEGESKYYKSIKGKEYPGIPFILLMVMFTGWAKYTYDIKEEIRSFYKLIDDYLFVANDHFPEDEIPTGNEE